MSRRDRVAGRLGDGRLRLPAVLAAAIVEGLGVSSAGRASRQRYGHESETTAVVVVGSWGVAGVAPVAVGATREPPRSAASICRARRSRSPRPRRHDASYRDPARSSRARCDRGLRRGHADGHRDVPAARGSARERRRARSVLRLARHRSHTGPRTRLWSLAARCWGRGARAQRAPTGGRLPLAPGLDGAVVGGKERFTARF